MLSLFAIIGLAVARLCYVSHDTLEVEPLVRGSGSEAMHPEAECILIL